MDIKDLQRLAGIEPSKKKLNESWNTNIISENPLAAVGGALVRGAAMAAGEKMANTAMDSMAEEGVDDDINADASMQTMMDDEYSEELLLPAGSESGEYETSCDTCDDVGFGEEDPEDFDDANAEAYPEYDMPAGEEEDDGFDIVRMQHLAGIKEANDEAPVDILPADEGYETNADESDEEDVSVDEAYDDQQVLPDQYSDEIPPEEGFPNGFDSSLDSRLMGVIGGRYGDAPRIKRESIEMNRVLKLAGLPTKKLVAESVKTPGKKKVEEGSVEDIKNKLTEAFQKFCEGTIAICQNPEKEEEMDEGIEKPEADKKAQARRAVQIKKFDAARKAREQKPKYPEKK